MCSEVLELDDKEREPGDETGEVREFWGMELKVLRVNKSSSQGDGLVQLVN